MFEEFENGPWLENQHPRLAATISGLDWVKDHIDDTESRVVQDLIYIASSSAQAAETVVALAWFQDNVSDGEKELVKSIRSIAYHDAGAAERIAGMPFLKTPGPADREALASLAKLARFEPSTFDYVMAYHSAENGITDKETMTIAMVYGTARADGGLAFRLVSDDSLPVQTRVIDLPLSGEVLLAIVRPHLLGSSRSMDLLEHSIRTAEQLMDKSLPTNYVGLLFADTVPQWAAGLYSGTHITVLPKYDVDDGSRTAATAAGIIAHEVAHYYWHANVDWVDEGIADFMALFIENERVGTPIEATDYPCAYAKNLSELERLNPEQYSDAFRCNYSLGERFFIDLYDVIGKKAFRQGLQKLYRFSLEESSPNNDEDSGVGIEHIRRSFTTYKTALDVVSQQWYDGINRRPLAPDTSDSAPNLPAIDGHISDAYVSVERSETVPGKSSFSTDDLSFQILVADHEGQLSSAG